MRRLSLLLVTLSLALLGGAASAQAAAPLATGVVDVQLWPGVEDGRALVIVSVDLAPETPLPATVQLPVFTGSTVSWAGEIAETDGEDIQREVTTKEGTGGSYAEFEVAEYRQAQVELWGVPLLLAEGTYSASLEYVQSSEASSTGFSVRLPAGAANVSIDPAPAGTPERNEAGETLYTLPSKQMGPGDKQDVAVTYTLGGATSGAASTSDRDVALVALLVLLVVAVIGVIVVSRRGRRVE